MIRLFIDIKNNFHALTIQFIVNIKTTVAVTRLGVLWWVVDPLLLMLIYTFVVKIIFNRGGPDYHLFALCGIITWQAFSRSVSICSTALKRNAGLIKQVSFPMHLYVLLPSVVQTFFYLIGLGIIAVWNHSVVGWHSLTVLLMIFPMILMPYAAGLFLSIFTVKIPDIDKIIPYILRFGFYISPVLFPPEAVYNLKGLHPIVKSLYALNPMVHIITAVRDIFLKGIVFDMTKFLIIMAVTIVAIELGMLYFRYFSKYVPKNL